MNNKNYGNIQKHLNPNPLQRILLNSFHRKIVELAQQTGATRLLDSGCGEGFVIKCLQQDKPTIVCVGGDFSAESLLWGRANVKHSAPLANLDIHHLPFPDDSFPLIICLEVLEHLPDSSVGLRELARVSSEHLLLSVPHEPLFRLANFLRGKNWPTLGNDPEHLHNYTGRSFRQLVGSVVDIVWQGYAFPWQIVWGRKRP
jgi:SAM-dependent methyltransferase